MKVNYGKQFENRFKTDWRKSFPESFLLRLPDNVSGYYGTARNPCDFIGYQSGKLYLLETKSHYGNTFPFSKLTQYDKLSAYLGLPGVNPAVVIWFIDHDEVLWVPLDTIKQMKEDGRKSVNIRKLEGYDVVHVPSVKKRVFMESDYTFLEEYRNESRLK